jgi:glycosyltransferase involved in cell wall biosynthesis
MSPKVIGRVLPATMSFEHTPRDRGREPIALCYGAAVPAPPRILVVTQALGPAGAERQIAHLSAGLAALGQPVTMLVIGEAPAADRERMIEAGVRLVELGALSPRERARQMRRITRLARAADVVIASSWDATFWGRIAAILARRPVIVIEHAVYRQLQTNLSGKPRARWIAAHNRLLDPFTYATVACAGAQLPVLRSEGVAERKLVLIPNGVPVADLRRAASDEAGADGGRAGLGIGADAFVIVHVARLTALKNQYQTVATARELRAGGLDVHVVLLGDGEDRAGLEAEVAGEPWAHLLGARDRVAPFLGLADLAVLPSRAEAMPMVVAEALAVGVPMVASDVGDVGEILTRTGAGIAVPAEDGAAFTDACRRMADPAVRAQFAARARAAGDTFDSSVMSRRYAALLAGAAAGRAPRDVDLDAG